MSGGGGGGTQTQMQTPWAGLQPYLGGSGDTPGLYALGYQNYLNRADGSAHAPVNHAQLAAQQMTLDNAMNVVPGIGAAYGDILGRLVGSTGTGPLQGNYTSPYSAPGPVAAGTTASAVVPNEGNLGSGVKPGTPKPGLTPGQQPGPPSKTGNVWDQARTNSGQQMMQPYGGAGQAAKPGVMIGEPAAGQQRPPAPSVAPRPAIASRPAVSPRPVYAGITAGTGNQFAAQVPAGTAAPERPPTHFAGGSQTMPTGGGFITGVEGEGPRPAFGHGGSLSLESPAGAPGGYNGGGINPGSMYNGAKPAQMQAQKPGLANQPGFKPYIGDNPGGNDSNGGDNTAGMGNDGATDGSDIGAGGGIGAPGASNPGADNGMGMGGGGDTSDPNQGTGTVTSEEGVTMPSTAHGNALAAGVYRPVSHSQMAANMPALGTPEGGNQGSYNFGGQGVDRVGLNPVTGGVDFAPVGGELGLPGRESAPQQGRGPMGNALAGMGRVGAGALDRLAAAGDPGNNPYLQRQVQGMADLVNRNLTESILPGIADQAAGAGMASSSRRAIAEGIAGRGAAEEIARQAAGMYGQAYRDSTAANQAAAGLYNTASGQQSGVDTARMGLGVQQRGQDISAMLQGRGQDISQNTALAGLGVQQRGQDVSQNTALAGLGLQQRQQDLTSLNQAAAMLPNLADMYMMPASMVESVGQQQQSQTQEQLDSPYRALLEYSGILGQGGQYTNTSTPLYRNRLGSAAGGAMAGMQMGGPWGAAIGGAMGYMAG